MRRPPNVYPDTTQHLSNSNPYPPIPNMYVLVCVSTINLGSSSENNSCPVRGWLRPRKKISITVAPSLIDFGYKWGHFGRFGTNLGCKWVHLCRYLNSQSQHCQYKSQLIPTLKVHERRRAKPSATPTKCPKCAH